MADAHRLVELFKIACLLKGEEREEFARRIGEEDPALARSLDELLAQEGPIHAGGDSFVEHVRERYGHI